MLIFIILFIDDKVWSGMCQILDYILRWIKDQKLQRLEFQSNS